MDPEEGQRDAPVMSVVPRAVRAADNVCLGVMSPGNLMALRIASLWFSAVQVIPFYCMMHRFAAATSQPWCCMRRPNSCAAEACVSRPCSMFLAAEMCQQLCWTILAARLCGNKDLLLRSTACSAMVHHGTSFGFASVLSRRSHDAGAVL